MNHSQHIIIFAALIFYLSAAEAMHNIKVICVNCPNHSFTKRSEPSFLSLKKQDFIKELAINDSVDAMDHYFNQEYSIIDGKKPKPTMRINEISRL